MTERQIDSTILEALGLTTQDVQTFKIESIMFEQKLEQTEQNGQYFYEQLRANMRLKSNVINIRLTIGQYNLAPLEESPNPAQVPDFIISQLEIAKKQEPLEKYHQQIEDTFKSFIKGFGIAALREKDWITAVNAFDVITEGGIMANEEIIARFRKIALTKKTTGVIIAQTIQERVNLRKAQQTPESTLTPVPPPPSPGEAQP